MEHCSAVILIIIVLNNNNLQSDFIIQMSLKRQLKNTPVETKTFQVWKMKPPGPEQRELERMFRDKEIDPSCTPDSVRQSNEMFRKFSANVFATHFRSTKAKLGFCGNFMSLNF